MKTLFAPLMFLILGASAPALMAPTVSIPGPVQSVSAPDGSGARIFYREHADSSGRQESPVFYDDGQGRVQRIATLQRSMAISWSHNGKSAFLQDDWASNVSDCYALRRTASGMEGASLLKMIERDPDRPAATERQGHYYVHCKSWRSPHEIVGAVDGYSNTSPSHAFSHPFTYDLRSRRVSWARKQTH